MTWLGSIPYEKMGMTKERYDLLVELAKDSEYWNKALSFINSTSSRKQHTLTTPQHNWVCEIVASLGDILNKRIAKDLFGF